MRFQAKNELQRQALEQSLHPPPSATSQEQQHVTTLQRMGAAYDACKVWSDPLTASLERVIARQAGMAAAAAAAVTGVTEGGGSTRHPPPGTLGIPVRKGSSSSLRMPQLRTSSSSSSSAGSTAGARAGKQG